MITMDDYPDLKRRVEAAREEHARDEAELRILLRELKRDFGFDDEVKAGPHLDKAKAAELQALADYTEEYEAFKAKFGEKL